MPKITVLMPVRNGAKYLTPAIESILSQSFKDIEFLIIDDGSTDRSQEVVRSFRDSRICFYQNQENLGVSKTLNRGLELASGEFIARMDADDWSSPGRLEAQFEVLMKDQEIGVCGSWVKAFSDSPRKHIVRYPTDWQTIRAYLLFNNPVAHPAVMIRREMLHRHNLTYDTECGPGQDYELWSRCLMYMKFKNIGEPLVSWRQNKQGVTLSQAAESNTTALRVQQRELERLGMDYDLSVQCFHRRVGSCIGMRNMSEIKQAKKWLDEIIQRNRLIGYYPQIGLLRATAIVWFRLCMNSSHLGRPLVREYFSAPYRKHYQPCWIERLMFLKNCLVRNKQAEA